MTPDVIGAISAKIRKLVQFRTSLEKEYGERVAEINREISELNAAKQKLNDLIGDYLCPNCDGYGTIRKPDAAGQMEDVPCHVCHGTGVRLEQ